MAQRLTNRNGSTNVPGSYPNLTILNSSSNTPVAGILMLVGEADAGPHWSLEPDLTQNFYLPDEFSLIRSRYRSGRLVDAAFGAISPSQDPKLRGAPAAIYLVKTNASAKAQATLLKLDGATTYHYLADKSWGDYGNLIAYTVAQAQAEAPPTTSSFTLLVPNNTTDISLRASGSSALAYQMAAADLPAVTVAGINALAGVAATGGADRAILTVSGTLALTASVNQVTITRSIAWATTPTAGDALYIPSGSVIQGATNKNRGSYVVTAATSTTITATKLLDAAGAAGAVTAPETVAAVSAAATTDVQAFSPAIITLETALPIDGAGKSLEVAELTSSTGRLSDLCFDLSTTKVAWVSKTSAPQLLASSAEYKVSLLDSRELDSVTEYASTPSGGTSIGGDVVASVGYLGTTATLTLSATSFVTTVTGGAGTSLSLNFSRFPTISDLASYVSRQPGYTMTVLLPEYGSKPPGMLKTNGPQGYLDQVSGLGICSTFGAAPGRLKIDARAFFDAVQATQLVQLGTALPTTTPQPAAPAGNIRATAGLPYAATGYLAGGTKAGTTAAQLQAAIDACEQLNGNFTCLLIAQDATADISDGETESSSTYVLEDAVTYARLQADRLSTQFERKPRQAFAGVMGSYASVQRPLAIRQSTRGRLALSFLDVMALGPDATSHQYQPWYAAVLAAAMQATAVARGIVHREPTQNGVLHRYGDYLPNARGSVSDALNSGLLPISRGVPNPGAVGAQGRWTWVSDQTCYVRDDSFYGNSIQAIFVADLLRMSVSTATEDAIVGESVADVDAILVKKVVEGLLGNALTLGYLASDDEAKKGYVAVEVKQNGGTFTVKVRKCKLATLIYFVDLDFEVSVVQRSA